MDETDDINDPARIVITRGYDEQSFCQGHNITTLAEAEAALNNIDQLWIQKAAEYQWPASSEAWYRRLAESTVEKFKSGEFPLPEMTAANGNTTGVVVNQPATPEKSAEEANPPLETETVAEENEGDGWLDGLQTGLDMAGLVPGLGIFPDLLNAGVSLCRGNYVEAGFSLFAAIPVVGDVAGAGKLTYKVGKEVAEEVAEKTAKEMAEKAAREAAERAEREAAERAEKEAAEKGGKVKGNNKEEGPCDHLRKGNGNGKYRGGAHSETKGPVRDGFDSHHMPADDASPLARNNGPAIHMEPSDHHQTSSNGQVSGSYQYRRSIEALIKDGKWREAMEIEIQDVKDIAHRANDPTRYDEAISEMLTYFDCLEKYNLLG